MTFNDILNIEKDLTERGNYTKSENTNCASLCSEYIFKIRDCISELRRYKTADQIQVGTVFEVTPHDNSIILWNVTSVENNMVIGLRYIIANKYITVVEESHPLLEVVSRIIDEEDWKFVDIEDVTDRIKKLTCKNIQNIINGVNIV